jgi:transcriptional regulator with XRE-family HTH domain
MTGHVVLDDVVVDATIYPRAAWSESTIARYAEALAADEVFPPIVLESGTNRLLDGMHRLRAHRAAGREAIAVEFHQVPDGVPAKLYAASLSARNGDRITGEDMRSIAREIATANPDFSVVVIAKHLGVTRQTVSKYVGDITERRREVRKVKAQLLKRSGMTMQKVADELGVDKATAVRDVNDDNLHQLTEDLLREAAADLPIDAEAIVEEIRQERIFATWSDDERELLKLLRDGQTVVVSLRSHTNLIAWATDADLYERVDRKSPWGNPFLLPDDGNRDDVIRAYALHYLPHKPSLLPKIGALKGKALGCWCAPEPCHAHVLRWLAEADGDQAPTLDEELPAMTERARSLQPSEFTGLAVRSYPWAEDEQR